MDVATRETTEPTVALVGPVGATPDAASAPADWPASGLPETATVRTVSDVADLGALLGDTAVDCVVATGSGTADGDRPADASAGLDDILSTLLTTVAEHDPDLPVVVAPDEPAPGAAAALAGEPATHYLPGSHADAAALRETIESAVATYDRHRQDATERSMFREVMEESPLSIYVKDEDGRHVAVSTPAEAVTEGSVIGKTDRDLYEETGEASLLESYHDDLAVVETGEPIEDAEERAELDGGGEIWLRTTKVPRRNDDGEIVGLLGVTRDVTPEKRREQELQRESRRLEQFASFASHDLRNPLTVANGNLELAREVDDPDAAAEHLDEVADAIDRMERLIDDLLDIARPEEDRAAAWTPLASVAERAWTAIEAPDATLELPVPEDYEVRAASGALRQLLENVLRNSVEHGGDEVTVTVEALPTGFAVCDDGPGIPEADRERVFEYGYTTGGSGIGLAITREIAGAHGWTVTVTESDAGGAAFRFEECLVRRAAEPEPVEGDRIALGEWRTVGGLAEPGGVSADETGGGGDAVTLRAGGRALWGGIEEYGCYATDVEGGVRIEGRVTGVDSVHDYSKAGLLLADATEPGCPLGFLGKTAEHGTEAAWRAEPDGPVDTHQAEPDAVLPRWYRIDRQGERVTFWASADGEDWTMVDRRVLTLADPVAVGLAVNSHEVGTLCEATFEAVRVVELVGGEAPEPDDE